MINSWHYFFTKCFYPIITILFVVNLKHSIFWPLLDVKQELYAGMDEISKQRQLNEMIRYGVVQDLSFYEMRWILIFSFKHRLMNENEIIQIWLKRD